MRKAFAWSMAAVLAASALSGCVMGGGSQTQAETSAQTEAQGEASETERTGELSVMVNNSFMGMDDPAILRATKAFEEAHPGVTISVEALSGEELISKYKEKLDASHLPTEQVLKARAFIKSQDGNNYLTNAAVLLFGNIFLSFIQIVE